MPAAALGLTGFAAFAWNVGVMVAASAASALISKTFTDSARPNAAPDLSNGIQLQNFRTTDWSHPLIYGTCRMGVNQVYIESSGADNMALNIVGVFGEGPLTGISGAAADGYTTSIQSPDALVFLNDRHFSEFGPYVFWEFFPGTATQNYSAELHAQVPGWVHPMRYSSYIYMRMVWDPDRWNGLPKITATLRGLQVYYPNAGSFAYSNNPAQCAYDMMTRPSSRGGLGLDVYGGPVPASPQVDVAAVGDLSAYNFDKGWTCNMPVVNNRAFIDNLEAVLVNCRGGLTYSETRHKLVFMDLDEESVVRSFDEDTIVEAGGVSTLSVNLPDSFDRPNAVRIKYLTANADPNGANSYQTAEYLKVDSAAVTADGDQREQVVELFGLNDLNLVQKAANYYLERLRWNRNVNFIAGSRAMDLEPFDIIQVSFDVYGWEDKKFRVLEIAYNPDTTVTVTAIEEDATFYDDTYNATADDFYVTTLPNINADVPSVLNASLEEELYYYRNRTFTRLKVDFDPPAQEVYPWWDYAEIWVRVGGGFSGIAIPGQEIPDEDYRYMTRCETDYMLDPVEEGEQYFIKIRSVSVSGKKESLSTCVKLAKVILGKEDAPSDLDGLTAIAHGDVVSIYANPVSDPDIEGYEVRIGDAWTGGLFISFNKHPSLRLNGVRPGVHTFWMAAKDNSGHYSENPVSATVKVFVPPGYTEVPTYGSWSWDYTTGQHDNTAHTTYNSQDALECAHDDDVLTGVYTATAYDLGAIRDVRLWGDFQFAFVTGTSTWDGLLPQAGTTWDEALPAGTTWNQAFEPIAAARLKATLYYSTDGSNYDSADWFEILVAEVEARYIYVVVTIIDPNVDANLYLYELNMLAYSGPQDV